jgi:hypothetical protein
VIVAPPAGSVCAMDGALEAVGVPGETGVTGLEFEAGFEAEPERFEPEGFAGLADMVDSSGTGRLWTNRSPSSCGRDK